MYVGSRECWVLSSLLRSVLVFLHMMMQRPQGLYMLPQNSTVQASGYRLGNKDSGSLRGNVEWFYFHCKPSGVCSDIFHNFGLLLTYSVKSSTCNEHFHFVLSFFSKILYQLSSHLLDSFEIKLEF